MTTVQPTGPVTRRITADEWRMMFETGVFGPDERLELIDGQVIAMAADGDPHVAAVMALTEQLSLQLRRRAWVSVQSTMWLSADSVPEPDLVVVRRSARRAPRPEDALLVIEVALSSLTFDRNRKLSLYAQAGVPEFWLVDLVASRVEVYRRPAGSAYLSLETFDREASLVPAAFPDIAIAVDEILLPD